MFIIFIFFYLLLLFFFLITNKKKNKSNKLSSVTIVGTARNVKTFLPKIIKKIEMISSLFQKNKIIIYENDSNDDTLQLLLSWKDTNKNVEIISEKNVKGLRTQRLAHGRNILFKKALKNNYEYLIILDMDNPNLELTKDSFLSSFKTGIKDWAVMTANQNGEYYDMWALRTYDDWVPFDCWECKEKKGYEYCVGSRLKKIEINEKPIKVKSAFGGLGIYKTKYINKNASYDGGSGDKEKCEHVSFNEHITKNGGNIYINPKMINCSDYYSKDYNLS